MNVRKRENLKRYSRKQKKDGVINTKDDEDTGRVNWVMRS